MSVHALPQFTPAQVLDAGRRAEAEGRFEFAQQFYRHLVTYYANTQEAADAQEGLMRIGGHGATPAVGSDKGTGPSLEQSSSASTAQPPDSGFGGGTTTTSYATPAPSLSPREAGPHEPSWGGRSAAPAHQPHHVPQGANGMPGQMRYPNQAPPAQSPPFAQPARADPGASRRQEVRAHPQERETRGAFELPPPARGYRTGRVMARLCTWLGGVIALAGCAAVPVSILNPRSLQAVPLIGAWLQGLSFGTGIIFIGLAMILLGQLMRALLEQANAARDLAAIARARAEHELDAGRRRTSE